jgi:hypothetical protein
MLRRLNHLINVRISHQHAHGLLIAQHVYNGVRPELSGSAHQGRRAQHVTNLTGSDDQNAIEISHRQDYSLVENAVHRIIRMSFQHTRIMERCLLKTPD